MPIQNQQPVENNQPLAIANEQPLALEYEMYVCTLCTSPTRFGDYKKLERHIERFHEGFWGQKEKGTKRKNRGDENKKMKQIKWE